MYSVFPFSAVATSGKGFQCLGNLFHSQGIFSRSPPSNKDTQKDVNLHRSPEFITTLPEFPSDVLALPDCPENHKEFIALVQCCAFKDQKSNLVFQKNFFYCFLQPK